MTVLSKHRQMVPQQSDSLGPMYILVQMSQGFLEQVDFRTVKGFPKAAAKG